MFTCQADANEEAEMMIKAIMQVTSNTISTREIDTNMLRYVSICVTICMVVVGRNSCKVTLRRYNIVDKIIIISIISLRNQ